jgi:small-conductance mechanosensitive channel
MEHNVSVWKANLTNGLILGLIGIVYTLVIYFLDLTFNKVQGYIFLVILIVMLFYLIKSYRDNYLHGYISYGQAVGAGVIIFLYYALIIAVFTYILYAVIDTGLIDKQIAYAEEMMAKRNMPQEAMDAAMSFNKKIMKPGITSIIGIFSNMFAGLIMSLLVAIFVKKEGNPLIESREA